MISMILTIIGVLVSILGVFIKIKINKDKKLQIYRNKFDEIYMRHIDLFKVMLAQPKLDNLGDIYKLHLKSKKIKHNNDIDHLQNLLKNYKSDKLDTKNQIYFNLESLYEILNFIHSCIGKNSINSEKYMEILEKIKKLNKD